MKSHNPTPPAFVRYGQTDPRSTSAQRPQPGKRLLNDPRSTR